MPKNLLQDMVKIKRVRRETYVPQEEAALFQKPYSFKNNIHRKKPRYTLWFVAAVSIIFFLFALSYLFQSATITVNPKMQNLVLKETLYASTNAGTDILPFDSIVIGGEESKMVQTTEEKDVLQKAEGVVIIYNGFGPLPQMLSIDTRLEGSNGKIYKTKKKVIVPGMKGSTPGSVEVGIYGEAAGEGYNAPPLDFKIFGFKGTPKYFKVYARSKGVIAGGFQGKLPFISDTQKASILSDLKATLQTKLLKKATDQIPSGFILFKDAVVLHVDDNNIDFTSVQDKMVPVKLKGTLYGLLFDEGKLTKKIAQDNISEYDGSPVYMPNIRDLTFSLPIPQTSIPSKDNISFADLKTVDFSLSGTTKIVWKLDENKLISDLLGKAKKDFNQILLQYPSIDSADLTISPFWKMSLPDKAKDIKIIVNYPK